MTDGEISLCFDGLFEGGMQRCLKNCGLPRHRWTPVHSPGTMFFTKLGRVVASAYRFDQHGWGLLSCGRVHSNRCMPAAGRLLRRQRGTAIGSSAGWDADYRNEDLPGAHRHCK